MSQYFCTQFAPPFRERERELVKTKQKNLLLTQFESYITAKQQQQWRKATAIATTIATTTNCNAPLHAMGKRTVRNMSVEKAQIKVKGKTLKITEMHEEHFMWETG